MAQHGGYRPGAGRKPRQRENKQNTTIRLSPWVLTWLGQQTESNGHLIERAVIEHYDLKPPGNEDCGSS